jgi:hypothetical protein
MPPLSLAKTLTTLLPIFLLRNVAPKTMGLSNPLFYERGSGMPVKGKIPGTPELTSTTSNSQPPKSTVTPKRPPPAVSAVL